jgi:hypothetical protein
MALLAVIGLDIVLSLTRWRPAPLELQLRTLDDGLEVAAALKRAGAI